MVRLILSSFLLVIANFGFDNQAYAQVCKRCRTVSECGFINPGWASCFIGPDYRGKVRCINTGPECTQTGAVKLDRKKEAADEQIALSVCQTKGTSS